ncbi:MAG: putative nucleotide-diphospho-sugar transferase [Bacteroidales bacterium]|nr:putative nucleotide-diphospho-sugar transferase [Bacteroidales bacterium]MCM1147030.1 putative nucleotide-diphospho-sugar transferase [Bacteroidales bacterium]MCM1205837.1 putative nucleotide-diphospho-sugar transferase [Bacillota bacterium]MCM1509921.1 putative nucleotide-diphospho-sugar transferase [Clostridium sp.]
MKMQIVYVLVSSVEDYFLEELWVSLYSLRLYNPEVPVTVLVDDATAHRLYERKALIDMVTDVKVISVPETYTAKQRSREIKTLARLHVKGDFLFIDTDTVICSPLSDCDMPDADIAAVPDEHVTLKMHPFGMGTIDSVNEIFNDDVSDSEWWFNSGVMYVRDTQLIHSFYKRWNENWYYSCFEKGNSQDQPALIKTDKEFGYIVKKIPDIYNCQIAMSIQYFHKAKILHFWHMDFIADQSFSPFMGMALYKEVKQNQYINESVAKTIINCKSSFETPTMIVGKSQIDFLFSPFCQAFIPVYNKNPMYASFLNKVAVFVIRFQRMINKICNCKKQ